MVYKIKAENRYESYEAAGGKNPSMYSHARETASARNHEN